MRKSDVYNNFKSMIGTKIDESKVRAAFEDYRENGIDQIYFGPSLNNGYDYIAYVKTEYSTKFTFTVDNNDVIIFVEMFEKH